MISENFLLGNETARHLYREYAEKMAIFDYHSHLPVRDIAENRRFENITQLWLAGDHYKWRAMRALGIEERLITGDAPDDEKFLAWAQTLPKTVRNPLYHWSYLELSRYFGINNTLLNGGSARRIYDRVNELLRTEEFSVRNLLVKMKVRVLCTTDDPTDDLGCHQRLQKEGFNIKVLPAFRPDRAMAVEDPKFFNDWVNKLEGAADIYIKDFDSFLAAIVKRHDYFHETGCRLSDHGLETAYAEPFTEYELKRYFLKLRQGEGLAPEEAKKFKSALMVEFARLNAERGWVLQLHLGAMRNVHTKMYQTIGPDTGYDAIGDWEIARSLARYLDRLASANCLPKTILYNMNPKDNEVLVTLAGSFQDASLPGKIQFGPAWWFLDQKKGMTEQLDTLASMGLLSQFIGMTTDSRSFLSYPRHEYFRRLLCQILGAEKEAGEIFEDVDDIGRLVEDICYHNARRYFGVEA